MIDYIWISSRINLTLTLENYGCTVAPNYASERQLVPLEDGLLSKDHTFWGKLEYVPFGFLSLCVDLTLGVQMKTFWIQKCIFEYRAIKFVIMRLCIRFTRTNHSSLKKKGFNFLLVPIQKLSLFSRSLTHVLFKKKYQIT